ncbi:MAG: hypothetical protein KDD82_19380, partial [Planctomycetes bacterium]|nr:hypothetical protein [Planctomycetota bacterium]
AGTVASDLSGAGNDLTLAGSPVLSDRGAPAAPKPMHRIYWGQGTTWAGSGNARYLQYPGDGTTVATGVAALAFALPLAEIHTALSNAGSGSTEYSIVVRDASDADQSGLGTLTNNRRFARVEDTGGGYTMLGATSSVGDGAWSTLGMRMLSATDHRLVVDGVQEDTSTADIAMAGVDQLVFGARNASGANSFGGTEGRSALLVGGGSASLADVKRLTRWLARPAGIATA